MLRLPLRKPLQCTGSAGVQGEGNLDSFVKRDIRNATFAVLSAFIAL